MPLPTPPPDAASAALAIQLAPIYRDMIPLEQAVALATPVIRAAFDALLTRVEAAEGALWLVQALFDSYWDGTIGRPPTWRLRGDFRHILAGMRGETLDEAIRGLRLALRASGTREGA